MAEIYPKVKVTEIEKKPDVNIASTSINLPTDVKSIAEGCKVGVTGVDTPLDVDEILKPVTAEVYAKPIAPKDYTQATDEYWVIGGSTYYAVISSLTVTTQVIIDEDGELVIW